MVLSSQFGGVQLHGSAVEYVHIVTQKSRVSSLYVSVSKILPYASVAIVFQSVSQILQSEKVIYKFFLFSFNFIPMLGTDYLQLQVIKTGTLLLHPNFNFHLPLLLLSNNSWYFFSSFDFVTFSVLQFTQFIICICRTLGITETY